MRSKQIIVKAMMGACLSAALPLAAQVAVIISTKNPISKLTPDQVSQIFLGQAKTFYTGAAAYPLDQRDSYPIYREFYQKVTGKSSAQVKAYWSKMKFSGNAQPPQELPSGASVVKLVSENPKYIGYVDLKDVGPGVKVVLTL
jgi:ABC-type phosphate transport system substrate-binding protein